MASTRRRALEKANAERRRLDAESAGRLLWRPALPRPSGAEPRGYGGELAERETRSGSSSKTSGGRLRRGLLLPWSRSRRPHASRPGGGCGRSRRARDADRRAGTSASRRQAIVITSAASASKIEASASTGVRRDRAEVREHESKPSFGGPVRSELHASICHETSIALPSTSRSPGLRALKAGLPVSLDISSGR